MKLSDEVKEKIRLLLIDNSIDQILWSYSIISSIRKEFGQIHNVLVSKEIKDGFLVVVYEL